MKLLKYLTLSILPAVCFAGTPHPKSSNDATKVPPVMCLCKLVYNNGTYANTITDLTHTWAISPSPTLSTLESTLSISVSIGDTGPPNDGVNILCLESPITESSAYANNTSDITSGNALTAAAHVSLIGTATAGCTITKAGDQGILGVVSQAKFPKPASSECSSFTTTFSETLPTTTELATAACVEIE